MRKTKNTNLKHKRSPTRQIRGCYWCLLANLNSNLGAGFKCTLIEGRVKAKRGRSRLIEKTAHVQFRRNWLSIWTSFLKGSQCFEAFFKRGCFQLQNNLFSKCT